jgi:hypothetical protein
MALPTTLIGRAHINLLEFMGTIISPWLDLLEGSLPEHVSVFSQDDNTTAAGWSTNPILNPPTAPPTSRPHAV